MRKINLLIIMLFYGGFLCRGQNLPTFDIIAGFGFPEAFHLGCKMHAFEHNQFGLYYGNNLDFTSEYMYHSVSIDHQLQLGKVSDISIRPVWFFRQGLTYATELNKYDASDYIKYLFLNFSGGREFNLSKKVGFSADAGLFFTLIENNSDENPWFDVSPKDYFALPFIRLQLFYSL